MKIISAVSAGGNSGGGEAASAGGRQYRLMLASESETQSPGVARNQLAKSIENLGCHRLAKAGEISNGYLWRHP
jgi:hypothetical protein